MSAAKMVADSTQSDVVSEFATKGRHRKSGEKKTKKTKRNGRKAKKKKVTEEEDALLNDPDLDLNKEVKDIGDYIRDRKEMLNQMFNAVQGASLQRALPDVLKELPLDVLKQKCLEHMEVMSKKRIRRILHGDDPAAISSSGTDDDTSDEGAADGVEESGQQAADSTSQTGAEQEDSQDKTEVMKGLLVDEEQTDIEEDSEGEWRTPPQDEGSDQEMEEQEEGVEEKDEEDKGEGEGSVEGEGNSEDQEEDDKEVEEEVQLESIKGKATSLRSLDPEDVKNLEEEMTESVKHKMETAEAGDMITPVLTKNQMELLELEMRARAIKAMLKKHQSKSTL
ncbi:caspase activity and apoptosis inhibitor 1-like [Haliotis rubra]|uniref:caspase activity and apoptosis inhibitor 1-like n=1 Tax=Haliotis rubra TaxID=36100 RepID=UPI001EE57445|nr:caspase activity and apoptosis inhibitor 1-like [Haliotis rubra]XP_046585651.1 caspase activity and apoptosis inhibitor 1-like [Haliotis rubra]XP_046585652.1 caspase activity and apoptosis inhibitor 1-like [Haliotis rubra]XP_046585654.1 caspase activity and apoptosis inhibitor 1-like [Haliotis rubra]XP_046585655.1 caspase activity and apoptosis inhibitor 1-like [Haliotis rubra]